MCLDFDRFKEVNDVYGHAAGDEMLRQLSKRLQAAVGGAFLARLGGDEFVVIATDGEQPAAAEAMADRLLAAVNDEIVINGQSGARRHRASASRYFRSMAPTRPR